MNMRGVIGERMTTWLKRKLRQLFFKAWWWTYDEDED